MALHGVANVVRKKSEILTPAEQRVMKVVWSKDEVSVGDVVDVLTREAPIAYTTVMTVLKVLKSKKYVTARRVGRALVYRAIVSREKTQAHVLGHVLGQFFEGSSTALAQHLLRRNDISRDELEELRKEIRAAIAKRETKND